MKPRVTGALMQFVHWSKPAPYIFPAELLGIPASLRVSPVTCKTDIGIARRVGLPHVVAAAASVTYAGRITYGARWLCSDGSLDVVFISDASASGGLCARCEYKMQGDGPGVYRVYGTDRELLYIGSSIAVRTRILQHKTSAPWRDRMIDAVVTEYTSLASARSAEVKAIREERPALNRYRPAVLVPAA